MVEKWLQNKGSKVKKLNSYHYGMPNKLFSDKDKDGVMNVFDCKPKNKRRQDVISPYGNNSPVQQMYARREYMRQVEEQRRWQERQLAEQKKLQEKELEELKRLSNVVYVDTGGYNISRSYGSSTKKSSTTPKTTAISYTVPTSKLVDTKTYNAPIIGATTTKATAPKTSILGTAVNTVKSIIKSVTKSKSSGR